MTYDIYDVRTEFVKFNIMKTPISWILEFSGKEISEMNYIQIKIGFK